MSNVKVTKMFLFSTIQIKILKLTDREREYTEITDTQ